MGLFTRLIFILIFFITTDKSECKSGKSTKPRHINPSNIVSNKISQIKKSLIPGLEKNLQKATEALSKYLDNDLEKKIKKVTKDLEKALKSSYNKKYLQRASVINNEKDCFDMLQNCHELKESNVCKTSADAMNKSCKKTCGFCNESILDIKFAPLQVELDIEPIASKVLSKIEKKKKALAHPKNSHKSKHHKQSVKEKPKPESKKKKVDQKLYRKCPSICKTNCIKGCPLRCCEPKHTIPKEYAVNKPAQHICPQTCREICSTDCPEVCCLKRFFTELANSYDSPMNNRAPDQTDVFNNLQSVENYDTSYFNPPSNQFTCGGGCPRSCVPECSPECCFPIPIPVGDPSALLKVFMDSSKQFTPEETTPPYGTMNINQELIQASFKPLIEAINYKPEPVDVPPSIVYPLPQTTPTIIPDMKECKLSCRIICTPECPKECCSETPFTTLPIMNFPTEPPKDPNDNCPSECDHHCTPSCLYSHCCKD